MKKNLLYYLTKHPIIASAIILICFVSAIYGLWPKNNNKNIIDIGNDNKIEKTLFAQNSPGATLTINENKSMPYDYQFTILEGKFGQEKWEELYNVEFILPNNEKAFLPVLKEGKKYIIARTFEDCSDIEIPEKYKIPDDFSEEDVCYTKKLFCGEDEEAKALDLIDQNISENKKALNIALQNNDENTSNILLQKLQSLNHDLYEIISYSIAEKSLNRPIEECIKLKE